MQRQISMIALGLSMILGMLALLVPQPAGAASTVSRGSVPAPDFSDIDAAEYRRAPVTLDGQVLFQVRGVPAYPAEERAKAIRQRIEEIAADGTLCGI